ncbi:hypothetical protein MHZ36_06445 [Staphylococcus sp. ACRSN]|nr:hypothetical protein [Staphylococcus sp. ACRSN]MCG7338925.1 hypothetical protein [Staphylococcus sp. ACRSN]
MTETLLDFMLGPMRGITDFYMDHLLVSNGIVLSMYFIAKLFKRNKATTE